MPRAAVLIGVSRSGTLPFLPTVIPSVKGMERWALQQGMPRELVKTLTDEAGPLEPGAIKTAIRELVDMAVVEQLIVYFAGHSVNIRYGEYWLLSHAPSSGQRVRQRRIGKILRHSACNLLLRCLPYCA